MAPAPSTPHDHSPRQAGSARVMQLFLTSLLLVLVSLASAAPALTLPLRETDGWSLEVPVKAGKVLNVDVRRGFTRVERLDRHAAFNFTRTGNTLHVGVKSLRTEPADEFKPVYPVGHKTLRPSATASSL